MLKVIVNWIRHEPVAAFTGAATALLDMLVGFGVAVPDSERAQVMLIITVLYGAVTAAARSQVKPTVKL